jgi:hypothetical protein
MQHKPHAPQYPSADDYFHGLAAQNQGNMDAAHGIAEMRTHAMQNTPHVVKAGYHPELRQPRK